MTKTIWSYHLGHISISYCYVFLMKQFLNKYSFLSLVIFFILKSILFYISWIIQLSYNCCLFNLVKMLVTLSCLTLWEPMDFSLPSSSVHGILQARILEWVDMPTSGGSSWLRNQACFSCIAGRFFTVWDIRIYIGGASGKEHICQCRRHKR